MKRDNLVRDKYNVGEGLAYICGYFVRPCDGSCNMSQMQEDYRCGGHHIGFPSLRAHFGNAPQVQAIGRRYMRANYSSHDRMIIAMHSGKCPWSTAYLAAQGRLADRFDRHIYEAGLRSTLEPIRGLSGQYGNVQLLGYYLAGRNGFTLKCGDEQVSFLCAQGETPSRMGIMSLSCSLNMAGKIVDALIAAWDPKLLREDKNVGIL